MDDVRQLALEFCRTCLGWENGQTCNIPGLTENIFDHQRVGNFKFTDLHAVLSEVRAYLSKQPADSSLEGELDSVFTVWLTDTASTEELCKRLMTACVEDARKHG